MPNCNNSLTILHLNIRSLNKNFDELHKFLVSIRIRSAVICLTETRIKNDPLVNITISQYKFCHVDSQISAGREALYVSDNFTFKLCPNQYVIPRLILNAYGSNYLHPIQMKNLLLEQYTDIPIILL